MKMFFTKMLFSLVALVIGAKRRDTDYTFSWVSPFIQLSIWRDLSTTQVWFGKTLVTLSPKFEVTKI